MRQELANPDHIPGNERSAEGIEEGEHDASSIVSNSHFATNTCNQAKRCVTPYTIVHRYKVDVVTRVSRRRRRHAYARNAFRFLYSKSSRTPRRELFRL